MPFRNGAALLSEKFKLIGAWFACLLILCGAWLASILYLLENARTANAIRLSASRIRIHVLEARRTEKDFVLRSLTDPAFFHEGSSSYSDRHRSIIQDLRLEIEDLGRRIPAENALQAGALLEMVDRYQSGFVELVAAYRDRGYEEWGFEGSLREALGRLRPAIEKMQMPELEIAVINLDLQEQAFRLRQSPASAARVTEQLQFLRSALLQQPREAAQAALEDLGRFETAFEKLLETQARIGFTEAMGLQGEFRKAIQNVEPVVEGIFENAVQADEKAGANLMIGLLVTCFIMAVLLALAIISAQRARLQYRKLVQVNLRMDEEHRKLLQSERLAAIGQTVTGLTHESRNALQRTHACLDMLAQELLDRPRALELVARIEESQDYLHLLYEQVREYAAPLKVERKPLRLEQVLGAAWEELELMKADRDLRFDLDAGGADLNCEADGFALGQVFRNIFENSLSACADPAEIRVRFEPAALHGRPAIRIAIADNGPGLDAEQRRRIFDPFYTTKAKGTGLGMAIAKRLVEAHDGAIEVGTAPQPGAEIFVTIPRKASR